MQEKEELAVDSELLRAIPTLLSEWRPPSLVPAYSLGPGTDVPQFSYFDYLPYGWIVDSGASYHLIDSKNVTELAQMMREAAYPRRVRTGNGIVELDQEVETMVPGLQLLLKAYIREGIADALSLGMLVGEEGCS